MSARLPTALFLLPLLCGAQSLTKSDLQRIGRENLDRIAARETSASSAVDRERLDHARMLYKAFVDQQWDRAFEATVWLAQHVPTDGAPILDGIESPPEAVVLFFRLAAEGGNVSAMENLGKMYEVGYRADQDLEQAFHWYQMSADRGSISAKQYLAKAYLQGLGVKPDADRAKLYSDIISAGQHLVDPDEQRIRLLTAHLPANLTPLAQALAANDSVQAIQLMNGPAARTTRLPRSLWD